MLPLIEYGSFLIEQHSQGGLFYLILRFRFPCSVLWTIVGVFVLFISFGRCIVYLFLFFSFSEILLFHLEISVQMIVCLFAFFLLAISFFHLLLLISSLVSLNNFEGIVLLNLVLSFGHCIVYQPLSHSSSSDPNTTIYIMLI